LHGPEGVLAQHGPQHESVQFVAAIQESHRVLGPSSVA
jgi:hypothetical protein